MTFHALSPHGGFAVDRIDQGLVGTRTNWPTLKFYPRNQKTAAWQYAFGRSLAQFHTCNDRCPRSLRSRTFRRKLQLQPCSVVHLARSMWSVCAASLNLPCFAWRCRFNGFDVARMSPDDVLSRVNQMTGLSMQVTDEIREEMAQALGSKKEL